MQVPALRPAHVGSINKVRGRGTGCGRPTKAAAATAPRAAGDATCDSSVHGATPHRRADRGPGCPATSGHHISPARPRQTAASRNHATFPPTPTPAAQSAGEGPHVSRRAASPGPTHPAHRPGPPHVTRPPATASRTTPARACVRSRAMCPHTLRPQGRPANCATRATLLPGRRSMTRRTPAGQHSDSAGCTVTVRAWPVQPPIADAPQRCQRTSQSHTCAADTTASRPRGRGAADKRTPPASAQRARSTRSTTHGTHTDARGRQKARLARVLSRGPAVCRRSARDSR
jgi:hypothetical protein